MSVHELIMGSNGVLAFGNEDTMINGVSIDTRTIQKDQVYVAIMGESLDGHDFLMKAYEKGVRSFIIDENHSFEKEDSNVIVVKDTTQALLDISKYYKSKFKFSYVAVTGSTGKTTTKDMIHCVLSSRYNTLKTEGNFNNKIGVPLTLFNLNKGKESCVIELGMSFAGEISRLVEVVEPDISVISNIGVSHIGNLGSQENIYKAKMEIVDRFNDDNTLIVNGDDKFLCRLKTQKRDFEILSFGFREDNHMYCKSYENTADGIEFEVIMNGESYGFFVPAKGKHNIYNAMSAILVGMKMNLSVDQIQEGLRNFKNGKMRLDIIEAGNDIVINDCYNASPDSMKSALDVLGEIDGKNRIAILGDMLEMGEFAEESHRMVGKFIDEKISVLLTLGQDSRYIGIEAKDHNENLLCHHFEDKKSLMESLEKLLSGNDAILVKSSRGMHMEEIVQYLQKRCN